MGLGLGLVKCLGRAVSAHVVLQHARHAQERGAEGVGVLRRRPAVGEYDDAQPLVLAGASHGVCMGACMACACACAWRVSYTCKDTRVQCACSARVQCMAPAARWRP